MTASTHLHALQLSLEDRMVSAGAERYRSDVEDRGLSHAVPGKLLMERMLKELAKTITAKLATLKRGRGRHPNPILAMKPALQEISPHILADLTMRRALDGAMREERASKVVKGIGEAVEWHVRDAALHKSYRKLWNRKQEQLKSTQSASFRRRSIDGSVRSMRDWAHEVGHAELAALLADVKGLEWNEEQMIDCGAFLLDCFAKVSAYVTTSTVHMGERSSKTIVRFSEGTGKWLGEQHEYHALLRPLNLPMVVEPRPWTAQNEGGYLDNSKARVPFIMTRAKGDDLDTADMGDAFDAVNLIQSTPLRVNTSVYGVMRQVWDTGSKIGNVPPKHLEAALKPIPELTQAMKDMTPEQRKDDPECRKVFAARRDAHEYNALRRAEVDGFARLMVLAEDYAQPHTPWQMWCLIGVTEMIQKRFGPERPFWHPYKLDWRQRCYPVCNLLSPQGDQFNRGLVEFARGKRMGDSDNSAAWLALHGANVYGIDKVPFEDRIAWVEAHQLEIIASAIDPFGTKFWQEADGGAKAWPFLAFCFEWAAYCISGDDHVTHLPVALDGSNSGLQHLSAMVRDVEGAQATNVAPCESPADIYTEICDRVTKQLERIGLGETQDKPDDYSDWANVWLAAGIDRKICKQPTMTYTYSATLNGMIGQIEKALSDLDKKAQNAGRPSYLPFTDPAQTNKEAARFLGPIVLEAIQGRLPKAAEAMGFLVTCARASAAADLPARWVTPVGVPIVQFYPKTAEVKKKVFIDGRQHDLRITRPVRKCLKCAAQYSTDVKKCTAAGCGGEVWSPQEKVRHAFGASPNFVHSMDSTHLLWTVLGCNDEYGIEDFSMIHDSFGTHATNCDEMALVLREMFVRLYSEDRLAEFRESLVERLTKIGREDLVAEIPPVPTAGAFELKSVLESQYFFA